MATGQTTVAGEKTEALRMSVSAQSASQCLPKQDLGGTHEQVAVAVSAKL